MESKRDDGRRPRGVSGSVRQLLLIFALAVAVNYPWELAQTPLYAGVEFPGAIWHCFVAALGDGVLVLLIFGASAASLRSFSWYARPTGAGYAAMAIVGLAVAYAVEWWGLRIAQRWEYSPLMPRIPGTEIGIVPVLQMLLLPPLIFGFMRRLARRSN